MSRFIGVLFLILALTPAPPARSAGAPSILVFGDSLSAAYGVHVEQGWVALLVAQLKQEGYGLSVVNASVSGETSEGGRARLPRALDVQRPQLLLLELGANDGLRGLPVSQTRQNLEAMIGLAQSRAIRVLLLGIHLPPNYGPRYTQEFDAMYRDLARRLHLTLLPFLLEGVATDPRLMQADGLHPNAQGQGRVLHNVWPVLKPELGRLKDRH